MAPLSTWSFTWMQLSHDLTSQVHGLFYSLKFNNNSWWLLTLHLFCIDNNATKCGTIYLGIDCNVFLDGSDVSNNTASYGGCLYGHRSSLNVSHSTFVDNFSQKLGGCVYLRASNAYIRNTSMSRNNALEDGGGIYGTVTNLHMRHSSITFNNANNSGGGMALSFDSLFYCYECTFGNNMAKRGVVATSRVICNKM